MYWWAERRSARLCTAIRHYPQTVCQRPVDRLEQSSVRLQLLNSKCWLHQKGRLFFACHNLHRVRYRYSQAGVSTIPFRAQNLLHVPGGFTKSDPYVDWWTKSNRFGTYHWIKLSVNMIEQKLPSFWKQNFCCLSFHSMSKPLALMGASSAFCAFIVTNNHRPPFIVLQTESPAFEICLNWIFGNGIAHFSYAKLSLI